MNVQNPYGIIKMKYVSTYIDYSTMQREKTVYDIYPDGKIVKKEYHETRKCQETVEYQVSQKTILNSFDKIMKCVHNATGWDMYVDDCSGELTIYHRYQLKEVMDRGLHSEDHSIMELIEGLLSAIPRL